MFQKILIANRGEIACRVIQTARRMGIRTVAIYSSADKDALHVQQADESIAVGPPPAIESYLAIDKIVDACRRSGAQAVHPGYGFLAENGAFAQALIDEGITFIGPPPTAMAALGDKLSAKAVALQAQVPTVPGSTDPLRDADHAVVVARSVGYPVLLKASAGGGGKGMRSAANDEQCREGFQRAAREAQAAFGDDRVFLEKYLPRPRHIEVQILADGHGNVIHLGHRECSLQRRHQKVIEEAPAPRLDPQLSHMICRQAIALARAAGYQNAGTVEFILDADHNVYFLEMNTRLQVEHPVTEMVTGLDLVEWMIRIAAGERLTLSQQDVTFRGTALEARVYAEDPARHFLPSSGRLIRFLPPDVSKHVRVDTGVSEGSTVSLHYDPLLAKVITHGATRDEALEAMRDALDASFIQGVSHNVAFLAALAHHTSLSDARATTHTIDELFPDGMDATQWSHDEPHWLVAVASVIHNQYERRAASLGRGLSDTRSELFDRWVVLLRDIPYAVEVSGSADLWRVSVAERTLQVQSQWQFGEPRFRGTVDGRPVCVQVERTPSCYFLTHRGARVETRVLTQQAAALAARMPRKQAAGMDKCLLSPMPGLLTELRVEVGHLVKAGQRVAVVEAMKMENVLCTACDGIVRHIWVKVGDVLAVNQVILELE